MRNFEKNKYVNGLLKHEKRERNISVFLNKVIQAEKFYWVAFRIEIIT